MTLVFESSVRTQYRLFSHLVKSITQRVAETYAFSLLVIFLATVGHTALADSLVYMQPVEFMGSEPGYTTDDGRYFASFAVPVNYAGMFASDELGFYSNESVTSVTISQGYRAAFGAARVYPVTGETTPFQSVKDLGRLAPESLSLRIGANGATTSSGGFLHYFDVAYVPSPPLAASEQDVDVDPELPSFINLRTDISLADFVGDVDRPLGRLKLDSSVGHNFSSSHYQSDLRLAIAVKDPLITTAVAMGQAGSSTRPGSTDPALFWGNERYGDATVGRFIDSQKDKLEQLQLSYTVAPTPSLLAQINTLQTDIADLETTRGNYTMTRVGCTVTTYAMALQTLGISSMNALQLQQALDSSGRLTEITGVRAWRTDSAGNRIYPRFNGADVTPGHVMELMAGTGLSVNPVRTLDDVVAGLASGNPVILRLSSGHSIMAYGVSLNASGNAVFDVFDPARRDGTATSIGPGNTMRDVDAKSLIEMGVIPSGSYVLSVGETSAATIGVHSPVRVNVIDPLGRSLSYSGFEGLLGSTVPDAVGYRILPEQDPDDPMTPEELADFMSADRPGVIHIPYEEMLEGSYQFEVFGEADGDYTVEFTWQDEAGRFQNATHEGSILEGQTVTFDIGVVMIPEPSSAAVLLASLYILALRRPKGVGGLKEA